MVLAKSNLGNSHDASVVGGLFNLQETEELIYYLKVPPFGLLYKKKINRGMLKRTSNKLIGRKKSAVQMPAICNF